MATRRRLRRLARRNRFAPERLKAAPVPLHPAASMLARARTVMGVVDDRAVPRRHELAGDRHDVARSDRNARCQIDVIDHLDTHAVLRHDGERLVPRVGVTAEEEDRRIDDRSGHRDIFGAVRRGGRADLVIRILGEQRIGTDSSDHVHDYRAPRRAV